MTVRMLGALSKLHPFEVLYETALIEAVEQKDLIVRERLFCASYLDTERVCF